MCTKQIRSGLAAGILMLFGSSNSLAGTWIDPPADVSSPNADIMSGSLVVSDDEVDLRIQFSAAPYPISHTHSVTVCFDTDQNPDTGQVCGAGGPLKGADQVIAIQGGLDALTTCSFYFGNGMLWDLDPGNHLWFDSATNTLRLLFPRDKLPDDGTFNYIISSVFGGSFGSNEGVPDNADFSTAGTYLTHSGTQTIEPFAGEQICRVISISDIVDFVLEINVSAGVSNSLDAKLKTALRALDDLNQNNDVAAINSLNALINYVNAQRGNKISTEDADALIALAQAAIADLESS